jgi:hypothetical protein
MEGRVPLDPDNRKTYSGVITLEGADGLNLKGCVLGVICESETWRRLNAGARGKRLATRQLCNPASG